MLIGDNFGIGEDLCGVVCKTKYNDDIISVWNADAHNEELKMRTRDVLKRVLSITNNNGMEYVAHDQSIQIVEKRKERYGRKDSEREDDHDNDDDSNNGHH